MAIHSYMSQQCSSMLASYMAHLEERCMCNTMHARELVDLALLQEVGRGSIHKVDESKTGGEDVVRLGSSADAV